MLWSIFFQKLEVNTGFQQNHHKSQSYDHGILQMAVNAEWLLSTRNTVMSSGGWPGHWNTFRTGTYLWGSGSIIILNGWWVTNYKLRTICKICLITAFLNAERRSIETPEEIYSIPWTIEKKSPPSAYQTNDYLIAGIFRRPYSADPI